jgi:hypothetical protein
VFIAGDRPVTEDQVRSKRQAEGWSNVQIEREGKYFGVSAMKNGQSGRLAIDSETGRLKPADRLAVSGRRLREVHLFGAGRPHRLELAGEGVWVSPALILS